MFAFSYPRDRWHTRTWVRIDNLRRRLFGLVQDVRARASHMQAILSASGLRPISRTQTLVWCVDVYCRAETAEGDSLRTLEMSF